MSGSYFLYSSILEKCGNFWKNDMAGLGKYHTGGYGRIEVHIDMTRLGISCTMRFLCGSENAM